MTYSSLLIVLEIAFLLVVWIYLFLVGSFNGRIETFLFSMVILSVVIFGLWIDFFEIIKVSVSFIILLFYLSLMRRFHWEPPRLFVGRISWLMLSMAICLGLIFGIFPIFSNYSNKFASTISIIT